MITEYEVTIHHHPVDGFSLYALDNEGYLVQRRYIGYTVKEAMGMFVQDFNNGAFNE